MPGDRPVGIDGVEIWTGTLSLNLPGTFAPAKGEEPEKYTEGLGLYTSSLPDVDEDIVTMGANASLRLMQRKDLSPGDIGRIDVATESAFDGSKPASTYIAGCLEDMLEDDFHHANKGERKFACISGTTALQDAYNWIRAGRNRGRSALIVASDTALYERGDPGEATQGAGAVAMLVDENPDLTAFGLEQGFGSADETDLLKPNQQFPSVDGRRSVQVYLTRMREALEDFESAKGDIHPDDYSFVPFHTPFPGMVQKAALLGYRHVTRDTEIEEQLADELGPQPRPGDDGYEEAVKRYTEGLEDTEYYREWFERSIEPTLDIPRRAGNWYTGSVHLARASALKHAAEEGMDIEGELLLLGSYGSGAQAEIHEEEIQEGWLEEVENLDIEEQLDRRHDLSFPEYGRIHDTHNYDKEKEVEPLLPDKPGFVRDGTGEMGERQYVFNGF